MAEFEFTSDLRNFLDKLQKSILPGVWSRGVKQSRDQGVQFEKLEAQEITARVRHTDRPVSAKVQLWPQDQDYFCDCSEKSDPCYHVAACIAALKSGNLHRDSGSSAGSPDPSTPGALQYRLYRKHSSDRKIRLAFARLLDGTPFYNSLTSTMGGIQSGRVSGLHLSPTQQDYAIDRLIGSCCPTRSADLLTPLFQDGDFLEKLFPLLRDCENLTLDQVPVAVGRPLVGIQATLKDEGDGFRLFVKPRDENSEFFSNGFVLVNHQVCRLIKPSLNEIERQLLGEDGTFFPRNSLRALVSEVLPALEKKIPLEIHSTRLPKIENRPPSLQLNLEKVTENELRASVSVQYCSEFDARDTEHEELLTRAIRNELHLVPGHSAHFSGFQAIDFVSRARSFFDKNSNFGSISGDGVSHFQVLGCLKMNLSLDKRDFGYGMELRFSLSGREAAASSVLKAWRQGESLVPLIDGGFATIPSEQLSKAADSLFRLLELKDKNHGLLPQVAAIQAVILADELGADVDKSYRKTIDHLRSWVNGFQQIPAASLSKSLTVELRSYQKSGVDWLSMLRDAGMGALLADDMGLGKTLQALCTLKGKSLIVAPASVLHSWADQACRFLPNLKLNLYHGNNRELDDVSDLTITSYGVLRQDPLLLERDWDCAVLDEAQTIKNPESQVTKAAHRIQAKFRLALSGTPVENRLEDLWSSFEFINPGILGSRKSFQEEWASPITRGDSLQAERLKRRIKPFILRRLKSEVAPELPPKTEITLYCDLSESERHIYTTLLQSTRKEVLEKIESGGSVIGALELLLRLRQSSCHSALVPGQANDSSSKLDLLLENLETTLSQGHRALIFSQWTSLLDLIEPRLKDYGISYLRLDGSTTDRSTVVNQFQSSDGPPVLLLSLKAGGVGLTLTAADCVYLMDSWWNPAVEEQAADRVHRIGQDKPVLICRLVARNTVEERILQLQQKKRNLAEAVLGRKGVSTESFLSREDLLFLLQ